MTVIIGYKDVSGESLIAADSRITWKAVGNTHADFLDKICIFPAGIAVAFSTSDVKWVANVLVRLNQRLRHSYSEASATRTLYSKGRSLLRFFGRLENQPYRRDDRADLLIMLTGNAGSRSSQLFHYTLKWRDQTKREIAPGKVVICGSILGEPYHGSLIAGVHKALLWKSGSNTMINRSASLDNKYYELHKELGHHWPSVGQIISTTYTQDGDFMRPDTQTHSLNVLGTPRVVGIISNDDVHRYVQHDFLSGEFMELKPVQEFAKKSQCPAESLTFEAHS